MDMNLGREVEIVMEWIGVGGLGIMDGWMDGRKEGYR